MADDYADFIKAIIGQLVALTTLAKLVDKSVISPADAVDVLDDVLLQLEEWQALFPDHQQSFQLAREASARAYTEIGISEGHHPLTHHGGDPEKIAKVAKINQFHVSLFAEFLQKLAATPEGDGSLLDHVLYLYGSGMGNPNVHDHVNLPIIVAGGAAGKMRGGRHIRYGEPTPLANLHLTLLDKVGVRLDSFADSQGKMDELFEPLNV